MAVNTQKQASVDNGGNATFEETCFVISSIQYAEPIRNLLFPVTVSRFLCSLLIAYQSDLPNSSVGPTLISCSQQSRGGTITHANSIQGVSLPPIISKQRNNDIISLLQEPSTLQLRLSLEIPTTMLSLDVDSGHCDRDKRA